MYSKIYLRLEPLGLELVAAAARRAGHAVRLIDLQCEPHQNFFRLVKRWQPDVIAFSVNYLANVPEIIDLARAARALLPQAFICVRPVVDWPGHFTNSISPGFQLLSMAGSFGP